MRHAGLLAVVVVGAGCAEPVVEMQLRLPSNADMLDTSCVTAVDVYVDGTNYPNDPGDYKHSCLEIGGHATYAAIRDAIHGKFTLPIPDTGLSAIEIYGWSGASACGAQTPGVTPDLIFYSSSAYIGQSVVDLPLTSNLNCVQKQVKVRLLDLFQLVSSPAPTSSNCAAAMVADNASGAVYLGTLTPKLLSRGVSFWGASIGADTQASAAVMTGYTQVGPKSCLAFQGSSVAGESISCAMSGPTVCSIDGEIEQPLIDRSIANQTTKLDPAALAKYPGIVYGSVWSNGATKHPLAGATIDVDPADGTIIYIDPPDVGSVSVKRRSDGKTGPSGLFLLFANKLATIKVNAAGSQRSVMLGSPDDADGAALIVMN